jgi:hypothetical protein
MDFGDLLEHGFAKGGFDFFRALRMPSLDWSSVAVSCTSVSALVVAVIRAASSPPGLLAIIRSR